MINTSNNSSSHNVVASKKLGWKCSTPKSSNRIYICIFTFVWFLNSRYLYLLKHLLSPFSSCAPCSSARSESLFHVSQSAHPGVKSFQYIIDFCIGSQRVKFARFLAISPSFLSRLVLRKISLSSKHDLLRLETIDPRLKAEDRPLDSFQLDGIFDQV
jgi:hypothetical protein